MLLRLMTLAGLVCCAVLAVMLVKSRREAGHLAAELQAARQTRDHTETQLAATRDEIAAAEREIAATRARALVVLTPAERARKTAGPFIARLKAEHRAQPPPPRPPPPPTAPKGGWMFPELTADPTSEFMRIYARGQRRMLEALLGPALNRLNLAPEVRAKVVDLLVERDLMRHDFYSLQSVPTLEGDLYLQRQLDELEIEVRKVMGDEAWRQFAEPRLQRVTGNWVTGEGVIETQSVDGIPDVPLAHQVKARLDPLEKRLSYTSAPLTVEQIDALTRLFTSQNLDLHRAGIRYSGTIPLRQNRWTAPDFLQAVLPILKPEQMQAVAQLGAELDALEARSRLPK